MEPSLSAKYKRWTTITIGLVAVLVIAMILACVIGTADISPTDIVKMSLRKIPFFEESITQTWKDGSETIIFMLRLPRIILAALIGSALAVAGTTYQALFKNPMADPYIIGVSSGAALGANIAILFGFEFMLYGLSPITFFAFSGSLAVTFFVYRVAKVGSKVHVETLLLTGVAISAFLSAMSSFLMYIAGDKLHQMVYWMMGGLWSTKWNDVSAIIVFILAGMIVIGRYSREMNLLLMGDETAQNLGVDVEHTKKILLTTASLITAFAVSVSGLIGFVGLVIPHIMRIIVGPDHRILIPTSALFGAIFLVCADTLARSLLSPTEIPVGIITAFFGGPFFTYLLIKRKRSVF